MKEYHCPECEQREKEALLKAESGTCPHCAKQNAESAHHEHTHEQEHSEETCGSCCGNSNSATSCCGTEKKELSLRRIIIKLSICGLLLIAAFVLTLEDLHIYHGKAAWLALLSPAWVAIVWCGYPIFAGAFRNLRKGKITSSLLISVAIVASIVLEFLSVFGVGGSTSHEHYLFAAGEIAFLMALGEIIEDYTVGKSRKGIEQLISLAPKTALLKTDDGTIEVAVERIKIGDVVVVRPDEQVSVDGIIVSGATAIDESGITGEYLPKDKTVDDKVFAGTRNGYGLIEIRVTTEIQDSVVMRLIQLTEEAEKNKAPIARIADKCASLIVTLAIASAVVVFLVTAFAFDIGYLNALVRGVTVLVVFCPCSLALATPTAIAAGLGNASKKGVLIKNGQALETLAKVKSIGFDKTGTLTTGKLLVKDYVSYSLAPDYFAALCASIESASSHPIGVAVSRISEKRYPLSNIENVLGTGISGIADGKKIDCIKWSAMDFSDAAADAEIAKGHTVIGVKTDGKPAGFLVLTDTLRDSAASVVSGLNNSRITTFLLTGDNKKTATEVASSLNIAEVYAEQLPHEKLQQIEQKKAVGACAFVGDGANDAPALSTADVGIAIGALGNAVAMDVADICLMQNDLSRICDTVALSKKVMNKIRFNITLAMSINFAAVLLSLFGLLTPVLGALVHNCSSLFVCANSAMLLLYKTKHK